MSAMVESKELTETECSAYELLRTWHSLELLWKIGYLNKAEISANGHTLSLLSLKHVGWNIQLLQEKKKYFRF